MDQDRFDRIARALGAASTRRAGLRAALGGLLGLGIGAAAFDAEARGKGSDRADAARRRHECGPDVPCPAGFACVKQGKTRRCACSTGVTCGSACCAAGQVCRNGACVVPAACIAPGEPCKGVGKPCCDGRTCASGQGGQTDVACYVHKTGACASTADCVFGTVCSDGRCEFDVPPPAPTGASCNPTVGQTCDDPAAVCTPYVGTGAPEGSHCSLPLEYACTGDPDCTCYHCGWSSASAGAGARREGRAAVSRLACCGPAGYACRSDRNCCVGFVCAGGTCQPETSCDVCASGCPYRTVAAAVADEANKAAGSTITVAPGTYRVSSSIGVNRSLTVRACGAEAGVVLEAPAASGSSVRAPVNDVSIFKLPTGTGVAADIALTVGGIAFRRAGVGGAARTVADDTFGIHALDGSLSAARSITAVNCTFDGLDAGIMGGSFADITLANVAIRASNFNAVRIDAAPGAESRLTATAAVFSGARKEVLFLGNTDATLTDCVVEGGSVATTWGAGQVGGGIFFVSNGTIAEVPTSAMLTLAGTTTVRGNVADSPGGLGGGGGIALIAAYDGAASLTMTGASSVTGNATNGHGSGVLYVIDQGSGSYTSGTVSATGTATRVFGNTGPNAQCELETVVNSSGTFAPLATCTP